MHPHWALVGAVAGALAANQLRRPMFALAVQPDEPDRTLCRCGARPFGAIPRWQGRCVGCAARIGPGYGSVEVLGALVSAGIALVFGPSFQTIGFTTVAVIGIALGVIDLRSFRLPNKLIGFALAVLSACLLAAAAGGGEWPRLQGSVLGAAGLGACYLLLAVLRPGQLGLGDVKLAVLLGMLLGWFGWPFVVLGGCLAFLLSAVTILTLLALRKITVRSHIPFGPFMLVGAAAALLL